MTIRQELKRRTLRAKVGFFGGMIVGIAALSGTIALVVRDGSLRDQRTAFPVWLILALLGGFTTTVASILAGVVHAYWMGRNICCPSYWPLLALGGGLETMKVCPYCGKPLDGELPSTSRHAKAKSKGDRWGDELA